jgi:hypothetical protein
MARKKDLSTPKPQPPAQVATPTKAWWPDAVNVTLLTMLAIGLAYISWRKWPDPQIDFGRELYLPWRIIQGALLFKDDEHVYGPLSQYFNSLVFRVGGVGLMTLVKANAVIYSAILGLLYYLVRAGWGRLIALASGVFFIGVFSFSHLVGVNNYNFLTPYSHEMTHGMLLLLCLILVARHMLRELDAGWVAAMGVLAGLSLLLKPEIILAATAIVIGAGVLAVQRHARKVPFARWIRSAVIFVLTGFIPMLAATLLFWLRGGFSATDALYYANYAWVVAFERRGLLEDPLVLAALGLDHPWRNLSLEAAWGAASVAGAAAIAWGASFFVKASLPKRLFFILPLAFAAFAASRVPWMSFGYALPGILLFGAIAEILLARKAVAVENGDVIVRVLFWIAAAALLARMALNPRIHHYGFTQAALAGVVCIAILMSSIPRLLHLNHMARRWHQVILTILFVSVAGLTIRNSNRFYSVHTFPVGEGVDRFLGFNENADAGALVVENARLYLDADAKQNNVRSLLVIPEGIMLNYLTRLPNSIPNYFFQPFVLANGGDDKIVNRLTTSPPDRIVVLSRDLREYGVPRFGASREHGRKILEFLAQNYHTIHAFGEPDVFDPEGLGFVVLARRPNRQRD